jgi:hypothetical protein
MRVFLYWGPWTYAPVGALWAVSQSATHAGRTWWAGVSAKGSREPSRV